MYELVQTKYAGKEMQLVELFNLQKESHLIYVTLSYKLVLTNVDSFSSKEFFL